jgi:hypothetical protein
VVIGWPNGIADLLAPAAWVIAGFLVLSALGNLASNSRFERAVLAATTAALALLCGFVTWPLEAPRWRSCELPTKLPTKRSPLISQRAASCSDGGGDDRIRTGE